MEGHELHEIKEMEVVGDRTLWLVFEDGFSREVDLTPILAGKLFGPLHDVEYFKQVRLDPEIETVVWPNGADFDPETLYNWDEYMPEMKEMAEKWREQESVSAQFDGA